MIFDRIENIKLYGALSPGMEKAVTYLKQAAERPIDLGEFEIDGKKVYGFCRYFDLNHENNLRYESHRRYIDIQYMAEGCEEILCAPASTTGITIPYDAEKDIAFHNDAERCIRLKLHTGDFAVFYPWDAHKPCCRADGQTKSKKIVLKIAVG